MTSFDEQFDLVIVGSGGGSMCAALLAADRGRKPVIIEKTELIGGSTAMSGGVLWVPGNPLLSEDGVEDSVEKGLTYLENLVGTPGPGSTSARKKAYLSASVRMVDFLRRCGIRFERIPGYSDYYDERPGGLKEGRSITAALFDVNQLGEWKRRLRPGFVPSPMSLAEALTLMMIMRTWKARFTALKVGLRWIGQKLMGRHWVGAGYALQGRMLEGVLQRNIPVWTDTAVTGVITEGGAVVGVKVLHNGRERSIGARDGVLLNTGGFSHNKAMREQYQPEPSSTSWTNANPGDTGEMIVEAMRVGAAVDCMNESWWTAVALPPDNPGPPPMCIGDMCRPHSIVVDGDGQRFVNEAASYMEVGQAMYRRHQTAQAVPAWLIIDSRHRQRYLLAGTMPGKTPQAWIDSGFLKRAGSIDDLARQCGLDPQKLSATVQRFNGFARRGVDEDFHRGARQYDQWYADPTNRPVPTLGTIEKPPFYAIQLFPGDVGTAGGIVTDEYARALRGDGSVIEGLYATGNATASVMGRHYPGAGASIGASFTFGFIAAEQACAMSDEQARTSTKPNVFPSTPQPRLADAVGRFFAPGVIGWFRW